LILGACLLHTEASAQNYVSPEVQISTEKASVGGNIFIVHKVQAKETLYAISKAYGVTIDQLNESNPSLEDGLKEGAILLIPTGEKSSVSSVTDQTDSQNETVDEPQDTYEWKGDEVITHRVKWYESLKAIANRYGVSEEAILDYNNITEIKKGMLLQIPMRLYQDDNFNQEEFADEPVLETSAEKSFNEIFTESNPLKISLILPLGASTDSPSANCFDFYCGALMALEKSRDAGRYIEVEVFDLDASADRSQITGSSRFRSSDLVIGPIDSKDIVPFAEAAAELEIPFVSPMDQKAESLVEGNEYFYQVPTSIEIQRSNLIKTLNCTPSDKVLFVYNSSMSEVAYIDALKNLLLEEGIKFKEVGYNILKGRDIVESLRSSMSKEYNWKVVVASEEEAFASDIIRNMSVLSVYGVPVEVYCSNKVRNFETIESDALFNAQAHVSAPYFVDYNNGEIKEFLLEYRALFNTEPTPYAFQGHDIFTYFIEKMYNANRPDAESTMELLQCNIRFEQVSPGSGWHNAATRNFRYDSESHTVILSSGKNQD